MRPRGRLGCGFASAFQSSCGRSWSSPRQASPLRYRSARSLRCSSTVPPSGLMILTSTPDCGAGVSSTTLSVSMSTRFSSRFTYSPAFLCQLTSVASATDSDSCGHLDFQQHGQKSSPAHAAGGRGRRRIARPRACGNRERLVDERFATAFCCSSCSCL